MTVCRLGCALDPSHREGLQVPLYVGLILYHGTERKKILRTHAVSVYPPTYVLSSKCIKVTVPNMIDTY
jgi:hypothetical protein